MTKKLYLYTEFLALFFGLPTIIWQFSLHRFFLAILWVFAFGCFVYLKKSTSFNKANFGISSTVKQSVVKIFALFAIGCVLLTAYTYFFEHPKFLSFPKQMPLLWLAVMFLYPLLSVYPQEIIYRAFIFDRYKQIFSNSNIMLAASSVSFGYTHIIFNNFIAVFLCTIGGILFGINYQKNKSLVLVSLDHALYGCLIFTIGLGTYFYQGAVGVN